MSELDRLLELAAQAAPDELCETEIDSEIGLAQITGRARHRAWVRRRLFVAAGFGTALAAAAVLLLMLGPSAEPAPTASSAEPAAVGEPSASTPTGRTDLELPTGDRLLAARGSRFRVLTATEAERRIRLLSGAMLFDVRPSARGRFHVETDDAHVMVVGTVFTVSAEPSGTIVRVYEGRVEITHSGSREVEVVAAGQSASIPNDSGDAMGEDLLLDEARRAAARRRLEPTRSSVQVVSAERARRPRIERASADEVRDWIGEGDAARALEEARARVSRGDPDPWALIEADALRALGRRGDAARAYTRAAGILPTPRREQAGFLAARLHASAQDALHALDVGEVSRAGSPLRERGLALRADLLDRLGRDAERAEVARTYLQSYPNGSRRQSMRSALP